MKKYSAKINKILHSKGITQAEMAKDISISPQSLSSLLKGKFKPAIDTIEKILKKYKVNANWFFYDIEPMFLTEKSKINDQVNEPCAAYGSDKDKIINLLEDKVELLESKLECYEEKRGQQAS